MEDINDILGIFVNTYNSGKYSDWDTLRSKFPELRDYDSKVLGEFVNTYNSGKYSEWDTIMSKFPEFGGEPKSGGSILEKSPKELYEEAPTPYRKQPQEPKKWNFLDAVGVGGSPAGEKMYESQQLVQEKRRKTEEEFEAFKESIPTNIKYAQEVINPLKDQYTKEQKAKVWQSVKDIPAPTLMLTGMNIAEWFKSDDEDKSFYSIPKVVKRKVIEDLPKVIDYENLTPAEVDILVDGEERVFERKKNLELAKKYEDDNKEELQKLLDNKPKVSGEKSWVNLFNVTDERYVRALKEKAVVDYVQKNEEANVLRNDQLVGNSAYKQIQSELEKEIGADNWALYSGYNIYKEGVDKGTARIPEFEEKFTAIQELLQTEGTKANALFNKLLATETKLNETTAALNGLPAKYKITDIINKLETENQLRFEENYNTTKIGKETYNTPGIGSQLYNIIATVAGGVERNIIKRLPSSFNAALAAAGYEPAAYDKLEESVTSTVGGITGTKASRFTSPTSEKRGTLFIQNPEDSFFLDVALDKDNNVVSAYNNNGDVVPLDDKQLEYLTNVGKEQNISQFAETVRNWKSTWESTTAQIMDVAATVGYAKVLSLGTSLVGLQKLSQNARFLTFGSIYAQYFGEGVTQAIRDGGLSVDGALRYGAASTFLEGLTEMSFMPLAGRLALGRGFLSKSAKQLSEKEFLATLGKFKTTQELVDSGLRVVKGSIQEFVEEIEMEYATPALQTITNQYLNGDFQDINLPTRREIEDLGLIVGGSTIIPVGITVKSEFDYIRSDPFLKKSLYKSFSPKYTKYNDEYIAKAVEEKVITEEEVNNYKALKTKMVPIIASLETMGNNSTKTEELREDIAGNIAYTELLKSKLSGNEIVDKVNQDKIEKVELEVAKGMIVLQAQDKAKLDTEKDISQQANPAGNSLPSNGTLQGDKGEIVPNLPLYIQEVINMDTNESRFEIYDRATDRKAKQYADVTFETKEEADAYIQTELNNKTKQDIDSGTKPNNTISFYHGGLSEDFTIDDLDVNRLAEKQQKKGRNYAGFYLYDETQKSGAETYSQQTGKGLHRFDISEDAKILELGNIERVTQEQLNEYRNQGYDLIRGKDVRGRTEYVLLNKEVVQNVVSEKTGNAQAEIVQENQEEKDPLNIGEVDYTNPAGTMSIIKAKLQDDGILTFEDENGNEKKNC